ncbi:flagellar biosynthesis protein FlhF [Thiomonas sp. FB-Cd]|uniref:flagellar biosynthesis protein FlhF n=1 Tax=Thiomonas sp. FB-Cd TaxID=1158292 RepID=UPI00069064B4|nr:flagellar biosynthesis protein FlhF [Thiomonas sp. FB-Cd]
MKIKRYTGTSTREVLARIRNDLGPDAVILSNREIVGGVELMAAVDFDASHIQAEQAVGDAGGQAQSVSVSSQSKPAPQVLAKQRTDPAPALAPRGIAQPPAPAAPRPAPVPARPAASVAAPIRSAASGAQSSAPTEVAQIQPVWSSEIGVLRQEVQQLRQWVQTTVASSAPSHGASASPLSLRLQSLGFAPAYAEQAAAGAAELNSALSDIVQRLAMPDEPVATRGIYALVGATGVGKTTTIAKLAARLVLRHGTQTVALVTTDTYRIGGVEQLKIYGRILGVPVAVARDAKELEDHLEAFADRAFVLIDTIGLSPRDARLAEQMQWLQAFGDRVTRLMLINGGMGLGFYDALWAIYRHLPVAACILTKLDETPVFGAALQWLVERGLPLWFYTDGQRVPEDLHVPSLAKMVTLLQSDRAPDRDPIGAGIELAGASSR